MTKTYLNLLISGEISETYESTKDEIFTVVI